jgi:hypothetical protein
VLYIVVGIRRRAVGSRVEHLECGSMYNETSCCTGPKRHRKSKVPVAAL